MGVGLVIALLALGIGAIAILKVPRELFTQALDPEVEARLEVPERQVAELREGLDETQERLDFTERALTRVEEARRLGKGE
jgi:hypothetical protein